MEALEKQAKESWKELTQLPDEWRGIDAYELNSVRGYSPIQISVREGLRAYFKANPENAGMINIKKWDELKGGFDAWFQKNEWQVRSAVFAANYASVGFGDVFDIAAQYAEAPVMDLSSSMSKTISGKDVMLGGYCEPIQRILNPYLFEDRFSMGGKFGDEIRNIYYPLVFAKTDPDFVKNMGKEWKDKIKRAQKYGDPGIYKIYMKAAKEYFGISYSEIMRSNMFKTGAHTSNSTWRAELGFREPYMKEMQKLRAEKKALGINVDEWILDNQALGQQLALLEPKPENIPMKEKILKKMLGRTPSQFFQLLAVKLDPIMENEFGLSRNNPETAKFFRALSNAEMMVWSDQVGANVRRINFSGPNKDGEDPMKDFNEIMRPQLDAVGIIDPARQDQMFKLLQKVREIAETPDGEAGSYLKRWAKHKFPLTLPLADYNVKNAKMIDLTAFANERRIRDMGNMGEAENIFFDMLTPEFMSPAAGLAGISKHVEKMLEFKKITANYDTPDTAEEHLGVIADVFAEINRDWSVFHLIGWIPYSKWFLRNAMEMDVSFLDTWKHESGKKVDKKVIPLSEWIKGSKHNKVLNKFTDGRWEHLAEHDITDWPHTLAGYVSLSSKYTGGEAMALHVNELGTYFSTLDQAGVFTNNRRIIPQLKSKHKAGVLWRYGYNLPRRFWAPLVIATISAGWLLASSEEKKHQ
jgi:hypothetical protein